MKVTLALPSLPLRLPAVPNISPTRFFKRLLQIPTLLLDSLPVSFSETSFKAPALRFSLTSFKRNHRRAYRGLLFLIVGLILLVIGYFFVALGKSAVTLTSSQVVINQTYSVLARDQKGNPTGTSVNLVLTNAEKAKSVLIQGKKANVRNGKLFLLINFEADNTTNEVYYLNPTDLVRYLRDDGKKFAPTVHQGIVQVRPNSTKTSNIGFVVEQGTSNFVLEVGEVDGSKQILEIKL